jgi:site-specific recombinase XerD
MARPKKGWKLYLDRRRKIYFVRFTHDGRRHTLPTGERDPGAAAAAAARAYAEVVSGQRAAALEAKVAGKVATPAARPFVEVAALWLADIEPTLLARTFRIYQATYVGAHFDPFFVTVDRLNTVGVEDYISHRLRLVQRETLKKELTALRRFSKWAFKRGYLAAMPEIEVPGRSVLGTKCSQTRKATFQVFSEAEIEGVLAKLPVMAKGHRAPVAFAVRARYEIAWETALRPATLDKLRAPDDYRRGATTLVIRDEIDKTRFGRELPLSARARAALDAVCPEAGGLIFGEHDYRKILRAAAVAAGIDARRAAVMSDYDFRHSRLTFLGTKTSNLAGVMYLAGHKQPATTARYLRPQREAAAEVLEAVRVAASGKARAPSPAAFGGDLSPFRGRGEEDGQSSAVVGVSSSGLTAGEGGLVGPLDLAAGGGAASPGKSAPHPARGRADLSPLGEVAEAVAAALWLQSGCRNITGALPASPTPKSKNPESLVMIRGLLPVRGGGIEPPWLLTASTSS